ncbi:hypothetical protein [Pseudomonas cichorii]|uniref:Uncharacterized protein n=1 Tax=Pseudomonas cichorii TaxID=36746 RepID=A0ABQ1DIV3_PSECI|nr:hypothetical protein [Pseudomonas cichorii]AHF68674.1 hypothetical protein PCH70_35210 [Pseudomonas cichorii JBC1]QVE15672.1 hypothetical protein KGD89_17490 [Pseudomonas cichorii]GFM90777.1 hypothetical protein PSCICP_07490 [Pseudomonas cichorii]SDN33759.1 hypothetical protein SAMN05216599_101669 [Pseudomonas cichorii]
MKIFLAPQRRDDSLEVVKNGSVLILNGEPFDFARMVDGDTLPASAISSPFFVGNVDNIGGELELTLLLPLPANYSHSQAFPEPLINVGDGPVAFPAPLPISFLSVDASVTEAEA